MPKSVPSSSPAPRVPNYRWHKPTGQAVVTLNGRDIYLGKWNTKQSRAEYDRLIGEWLAAGRCLPKPETDLTVAELGVLYLRYSQGYYRKNGEPTSTVDMVRRAIWWIRQLEALQVKMIAVGLSRNTINETVATIRRMFRWGGGPQRNWFREASFRRYRPASHKTVHRERDRVIAIGPRAQDVLRP